MSSNVLTAPEVAAGVFSDTSSHDVAVSVRGLAKSYSIAKNAEKHSTLGEAMIAKLKNPFAKIERDTFWALSDVNFDIQKGDVVGIIGRNGAGKSTLLKILSRITEPTKGKIDLYGRVGSLLEVGTGFHPELTGRENIFLNGAILGMSKSEIARQFDEIVEFSGTEQFLDTPVKRYSSGMYVRLAFAVAAHLNPEILIIDEVLAVGDAEFQKKCIGKMQDVARGGRTVIFVSHNMAAIRQLCNTAIMMTKGRLVSHGATEDVVIDYLVTKEVGVFSGLTGKYGVELSRAAITDNSTGLATSTLLFNQDYTLAVSIRAPQRVPQSAVCIRVFDEMSTLVSSIFSAEEGLGLVDFSGDFSFVFPLQKLQLLPGHYTVSVSLCNTSEEFLREDEAFTFEVLPSNVNNAAWAYQRGTGLVRLAENVSLEKD